MNFERGLRLAMLLAPLTLTACGNADTAPNMVSARVYTAKGPLTFVHPQGDPLDIEKIVGDNSLIPVVNDGANIPPKLRPLINAFGLISMGCTATHIGNGLALTAGHCFDAPRMRTNDVSCPKNTTVRWGLRADSPAKLISRCTQILAYEFNSERDYAIFKVDRFPAVHIDVDFINKPRVGTKVTIFGHPQARPLEWSGICTVQSAARGGWSKNQFSHQCDTEPGNSGSTVISVGSLKVVGIHDGGRAPWNYATLLADTPLADVKRNFLALR